MQTDVTYEKVLRIQPLICSCDLQMLKFPNFDLQTATVAFNTHAGLSIHLEQKNRNFLKGQ
jgi:hypothetical protein